MVRLGVDWFGYFLDIVSCWLLCCLVRDIVGVGVCCWWVWFLGYRGGLVWYRWLVIVCWFCCVLVWSGCCVCIFWWCWLGIVDCFRFDVCVVIVVAVFLVGFGGVCYCSWYCWNVYCIGCVLGWLCCVWFWLVLV